VRAFPDGWQAAPLGEVCRVVSGSTPKTGEPAYWGAEVKWITPNDLSRDRSQVVDTGERSLTTAGYDSCSAQLFPAGSVIVSSRAPIGYVAIAGDEMCTNQGCKTAVPPEYIDSRYLYWFLVNAKPDLEARASGTTFKEISGKRFAETAFWWPELSEQRRIVEVLEDHLSRLDAAEQIISIAGRRLVAWQRSSLDRIVRTDASSTGRLRDLVDRIEAGKSFGGSAPPARDGQWGVIKVSAMTWGRFRAEENKAVSGGRIDPRFEIQPGDVLVSRANTTEYVGAPVLVEATPPRLLLSDKSLRLVPREGVEPRWLVQVLAAPATRRQISLRATGTKDSMRNISQAALLDVTVPVATLEQQDRVIAFADSVDGGVLKAGVEFGSARVKSSQLRRVLLEAAFTGRLSGQASNEGSAQELPDV
jgi:type I restriction enzyme S subunit